MISQETPLPPPIPLWQPCRSVSIPSQVAFKGLYNFILMLIYFWIGVYVKKKLESKVSYKIRLK